MSWKLFFTGLRKPVCQQQWRWQSDCTDLVDVGLVDFMTCPRKVKVVILLLHSPRLFTHTAMYNFSKFQNFKPQFILTYYIILRSRGQYNGQSTIASLTIHQRHKFVEVRFLQVQSTIKEKSCYLFSIHILSYLEAIVIKRGVTLPQGEVGKTKTIVLSRKLYRGVQTPQIILCATLPWGIFVPEL